ncbi:MAG: hypothetical protein LBB29_01235 [Holosporaceae bacterium]|nr:hypothetical protein [Holosporaceae bacterium]
MKKQIILSLLLVGIWGNADAMVEKNRRTISPTRIPHLNTLHRHPAPKHHIHRYPIPKGKRVSAALVHNNTAINNALPDIKGDAVSDNMTEAEITAIFAAVSSSEPQASASPSSVSPASVSSSSASASPASGSSSSVSLASSSSSSSPSNDSTDILLPDGRSLCPLLVPGDGDCGYHALGITRQELADTLNIMLTESVIPLKTKKFIIDNLNAQIKATALAFPHFKNILKTVKNEERIQWFINTFIGLSVQDFLEIYEEFGFVNFLDLSVNDVDTQLGLGMILATILEKTIHLDTPVLHHQMISFSPVKNMPVFTLQSEHQFDKDELWLLHNGEDHYDAAFTMPQ